MRTSKPISTISYNTENFLVSKLNELVDNGILDFWVFIEHAPEVDEKKEHKHLYLMPSTIIQTDYVKKCLQETDLKNPEKPLGITIFVSSKFDDWYLYGCHDKAYLASKGQTRKYHYVKSQFLTSNDDHFGELVRCVDRSKFVGMERVIDAVENNVSFQEMVRLGQVPIQLINQYKYAYECIAGCELNRNGRETHTPKPRKTEETTYLIDEETGEIVQNPFYEEKKKQERKTPASSEN